MNIKMTDAITYAFTLSYLHTKLANQNKLSITELTELWEIEEKLNVEKSQMNESKALRKEIINCYAALLIMFQDKQNWNKSAKTTGNQ